MSRNGSGTYTMPSNSFNPAVSGQSAQAADWNSTRADIEAAITASIANDGQTVCSARIPFAAGLSALLGSTSSVPYSFTSDANTGMYSPAADKVGFVAGGTEIVRLESGQLAPVANNSIDLGTSSLKFKDGYFAGALTIGGNITNSGTISNIDGTFADAPIEAISILTMGADKFVYFTGTSTAVAGSITAFGRSLIDDGSAGVARSTLGLGSLATQNGITSSDLPSGTLLQTVSNTYTATTGLTATIPTDGTTPQNTEGTEVVTQAITPSGSSNILEIEFIASATSSAGREMIAALFQDSTADALTADLTTGPAANYFAKIHLVHRMTAGTTSATTFKIRIGPDASGTVYVNGDSGGAPFGAGGVAARLTIREYKA